MALSYDVCIGPVLHAVLCHIHSVTRVLSALLLFVVGEARGPAAAANARRTWRDESGGASVGSVKEKIRPWMQPAAVARVPLPESDEH